MAKLRKHKVGFTCGAMDLLHAGHILMLKEAKELACEHLIVGLHRDPTIDRPSKNKPVESVEERRERLLACKYVDDIWEYDTEAELLAYLEKNCRKNGGRIDVRIVGADYLGKDFTGKHLPLNVHYNERGHSYSTTNLRTRVYEAEVRDRRRKQNGSKPHEPAEAEAPSHTKPALAPN